MNNKQMAKLHDIKILDKYFDAIRSGQKLFEVRKNDRDYKVGDFVKMREWNPIIKGYTGWYVNARISYFFDGDGVANGYCVFGINDVEAGYE